MEVTWSLDADSYKGFEISVSMFGRHMVYFLADAVLMEVPCRVHAVYMEIRVPVKQTCSQHETCTETIWTLHQNYISVNPT